MILSPFLRVKKCVPTHGTRNYSSLYPYKKLRAYPFVLPPDQAKLAMGIFAQKYCGEERYKGVFTPLIPLMWDFFKYQPKLPVTFSAIYLPFWIFGAHTYLRWTHMGDDEVPQGKKGAFNAQIPFFPVPGTNAPLFPTAPQHFNWELLRKKKGIFPRPFSEPFLKEQEESTAGQITCLPYTTSPLALLKLIQSSPGRKLDIGGHHIQVDQANVSGFTAMPVLLPMYVAKYRDKDGEDLIMFIDAYLVTAPPSADRRQLFHLSEKHGIPLDIGLSRAVKDLDYFTFAEYNGRIATGIHIDTPTHLTVGSRSPLDKFMDDMLGSAENLSQLASLGSLPSDSDDRIVEMTESEIQTRWAHFLAYLNLRKKQTSTSAKNKTNARHGKNKLGIWSKYSSLPTPPPAGPLPKQAKPKGR